MKIGIVSRTDREDALELIESLVNYLEENKVCIEIEKRVTDVLTEYSKYSTNIKDMDSDIVLCIGGDGTVLYAQHTLSKKKIPVLSINMGTVGFLTEVDPEDIFECMDQLLSYDFFVEERMQLDIKCDNEWQTVLNELVLMTNQPAKMLDLTVCLDDEVVDEIHADGLIISTPSGSTAYAMSAGGPIVDPRVDAALIIPICPFKLNSRPIIVPSSSTITIKFNKVDKKAVAVLDGVTEKVYSHNDEIKIRKSEHNAHFVRFTKKFYDSVNKKLTKVV
ncbi:NAD(+) kinase [Methanosphaera sp. BMS]|uniref:NAD(+) kinase n=1 Tax=Methanosphaera sp. BMS TaxID=1789762 RepID=UPI000DC1E822|nr:NAD(+) kinase [Methanosphaera sp. BMS]AWX33192.1 NAD(+) kinase [Methanosphaera sp. BMS]